MGFDQAQLFEIREERTRAAVTLRLSGEFDMAAYDEFGAAIKGLNGDGLAEVVIDLAELTFIDSSGIRALLVSKRQAEESGLAYRVRIPENGQVRQVFELTAVDELLDGTGPA